MSEQSAVLESAPTEVIPEMEVSRGPLVNLSKDERKEYGKTGILPIKEASATSPATGDSETPKQQEKPRAEQKRGQTAQERIAELKLTIERIEKGAGLDSKPKAESAPATPEHVEQTRTKPTPEDKNSDGSDKYPTHEDYIEGVVEWNVEKREAGKAAKAQEKAQADVLDEKINEARTRYGSEFDKILQPSAEEIYKDAAISPVIKTMIGDSEVMVDLIYTLASDPAEFAKFKTMAAKQPGKAIRYIALTESLIAQEIEAKTSAPVEIKTEETPAKPKTQAPKPVSEVGGRASTPPDSLQSALEGSGGKLSGGLKAEFLRRDLARLKG